MKPDFSGYATKAGLRCSDGRTILAHAFQNQDKATVPLVYQHVHSDVKGVLGHAVLEDREDGVYTYGFFNETPEGQHAKKAVQHGDISAMSIYANQLVERSKNVLHGVIKEVSLVLAGANPGALIDNIAIAHSDGGTEELEDEAIIYTGLEIAHGDEVEEPSEDVMPEETSTDATNDSEADDKKEEVEHAEDDTIAEIYDAMSKEQKNVVHYMVGKLMAEDDKEDKEDEEDEEDESLEQSDLDNTGADTDDTTNDDDTVKHEDNDQKETTMKHNVFEDGKGNSDEGVTLSHGDLEAIKHSAKRYSSLKDAVEEYALQHGITDIDTLFPDAQNVASTPEFLKRRTEWVGELMGNVNKSPFARIKTMSADITVEEARAKGYVTKSLKREEFFSVKDRVTTPTTVYKKQKLERDDMIDITDFDVVAWLKGEMRIMLDEELARAILLGDGRDVSSPDKVNETHIRPIATDHEMYTTRVSVNIDDADSDMNEVLDAIIRNRRHMRGTGIPVMYTSESYIAQFMLLRDGDGRRLYKNLEEIAAELRVAKIVPVEVMEEYADIVCILVNPFDYRVGTDKGGQVTMFDDFDIDYNNYKYLIETRMSGALTRLKSALVVNKVASALTLVTPVSPSFDAVLGELTIPTVTGVIYKNLDTDATMTTASSPYAVASGISITVYATPDTGYYFESSENDTWEFTAD